MPKRAAVLLPLNFPLRAGHPQQLVKALEKAAGEELAEKAKKEAVEAAKKEKMKDC